MKHTLLFIAALIAAFVFQTNDVRAQIPVTVTSDVQGALGYVQDAVNQVQDLQQWANQYIQMAQQLTNLEQQVQQYSTMLNRMGDFGEVLGLYNSAKNTAGNLMGTYKDLQNFGNNLQNFQLQAPNLEQLFGSLPTGSGSAYKTQEEAFDNYVKAAEQARKSTQDSLQQTQQIAQQLDQATDQATVMKLQGALQTQAILNDANAQVAQQAHNDLVAADIARRSEADKRKQAALEANAVAAAALEKKDREEAIKAAEEAEKNKPKLGSGQPRVLGGSMQFK